jgi:hypothetical protein
VGRRCAVLLFTSLLSGADFSDISAVPPTVNVCLLGTININAITTVLGKSTASHIFEKIGLRLNWSCLPSSTDSSKAPLAVDVILVQIEQHAPAHLPFKALACALPYARNGVRVSVFYDRLQPYLDGSLISGGRIFGCVLAHEIGHVLARTDVHANAGLMRGHWTAGDFTAIAQRSLYFDRHDAELIRQAVALRCKLRVVYSPETVRDVPTPRTTVEVASKAPWQD